MTLAIVLDLRGETPLEVAAGMRALALAFAQAREPGDHFCLIAAGRSGGVAVDPGAFRHGPLALTLDRLLSERADAGVPLDLAQATALALERLGDGASPDAPPGSSAVVLVTGQPLGESLEPLVHIAHRGAVAGIPTSVVAVGTAAPAQQIDRLALAGQGSRRLLTARSEAAALVERELGASSRAVARALRLRIRLAPGVRLVELVGSQRLDGARAQRVREAERAIDLRLSRALGIESDRGEDEGGIQIVIPSFHADDQHVVLLDVVAPGPGPVADVTVRYKDLLYLRNGVARASAGLSRGARARGPLERRVLVSLLAQQLSETLERAAQALRSAEPHRAAALLRAASARSRGVAALWPGLAGECELARDVAMLDEYTQLLERGAATQHAQRSRLADSLLFASRLKRLPRPDALTLRT